ncbi:MAG: diaminopimelate epimerase, partial [Thermomicrobiales bacterium]
MTFDLDVNIENLIKPLPIWKMSGSGNDFIVIDNRDERLPEPLKSSWTRRVCRPRVGLGADGVVLIERVQSGAEDTADVRWRYFNADGSEGEMCGNGAMCGARFAIEQGIAPNPCRMLTQSGVVRAQLTNGTVWLEMPDTGPVEFDIDLPDLPSPVRCHAISVGVPHVVIPVEDADRWPNNRSFDEIGRAIRYHPRFAPAGTNVNVISKEAGGGIRMRTWERGVEAGTLACGTGAVASAIVSAALRRSTLPTAVRTSSGRILRVYGHLHAQAGRDVRLGGIASIIA